MLWIPRLLSFSTGLLSLSQEILWIRYVGFANSNTPQAFGFVLGLYLLGIAIGAEVGKRYCRGERDLYSISGWILLVAAFVDLAAPYAVAAAFTVRLLVAIATLVPAIVLTAMLKSMIFPIAHHLGSSRSAAAVGSSVSKVYFANILGATCGPLLTGFALLQHFSLEQCMALMAALTFILALFCFAVAGRLPRYAVAFGAGALAIPFVLPGVLISTLIDATKPEPGAIGHLLENRYGIIHTLDSPDGDDSVYGGNVYDGRVNTDLLRDSNKIRRAYVLAALHPDPKRVLIIGLSVGSWTKVISGFPGVGTVDVLEINPGYAELLKSYPELSSLLLNEHVRFIYDDGRRWLKRNPEQSYDLVVMNTTFHWRAYAGFLLSREFLEMLKQHLNPGAIVAYNATNSLDVLKTASIVFKFVYKLDSFVYVADHDMMVELPQGKNRLAGIQLDGKAALDLDDPTMARKVEEVLSEFEAFAMIESRATRRLEIVTDQNLITEYKYGRGLFGYFTRRAP